MGVDLGKMKKSTRHRDPKVEGCCLDKNLHSGTRFISQERAKWTKTSGQVDKDKWTSGQVVLRRSNGVSLSHEIHVMRLVAAS